jgi:hypothetical protein
VNAAGEKSYTSGAWVDMTSIVIMVDAAPLAASLAARFPIALRRVTGAPEGKHPVCLELWRVRDGRFEMSGVDQHEWSALAGSTVGAALGTHTGALLGSTYGATVAATMGGLAFSWLGPLGALWGASAGFVAGATSGGLAGASAGSAFGEEILRRTAREASDAAARRLGTYHETALLVPNVVRHDGSGPPHQFVLGMLTDSALSKWEAEAVGHGFGKQLATVRCRPFQDWKWTGDDGRSLLEARFAPSSEPSSPRDESALAIFREWTRAPFLGPNVAGELVATDVDRFLDDDSGVVPGSGVLSVAGGFTDFLEPGQYELGGEDSRHGFALHARDVFVRVTRPGRFDL